MSKHSPGPWQWLLKDGKMSLRDARGMAVATGGYNGIIVQGEDNARLLDAAPELLEALKDLLALDDNHMPDYGNARALILRLSEES
jgi:hypothetical protein